MKTLEHWMKNKYLILIFSLCTFASCSSAPKKQKDEVVNKPSPTILIIRNGSRHNKVTKINKINGA
jgi:hypothetical protein